MVRSSEGGGAGDGGKRGRRKGIRRLNCFNPAGDPSIADVDDDRRRDVGESASAGAGASDRTHQSNPTHLVVTVNGIVGSAEDWKFAAEQLVKTYPEDVIVHCSQCNYSTLTFDGVDVMGERLANEVMSVVAERPQLHKISFIAHSLGGLIARYAIGRLYGQAILREFGEQNGEYINHKDGAQRLEQRLKGKIAGLDPINFITFATPHLGSRSHKQIPFFRGSYALEKLAYHVTWIFGITGKHLMLKDKDDGNPPILLQMVDDCGNLQFMSALSSFRRRVAYSNISFDILVGWKIASIRYQHELPKQENFTRNEKYPHIVYVEKPKAHHLKLQDFLETDHFQPRTASEMEDAMIKGLNRVSWERVDVSFRDSKQRLFAHDTIQVYCGSILSERIYGIYTLIKRPAWMTWT